jgi:hypothetical protein
VRDRSDFLFLRQDPAGLLTEYCGHQERHDAQQRKGCGFRLAARALAISVIWETFAPERPMIAIRNERIVP